MGTLNDEDFEFFSQLTRARKNKNLDQLLKSFTPEELAKANSLLATEIAIQVDEVMLADEEIIEASMKEVEHNQTTWDAHKEWLVQEKILPDSAIEDTEKSTKRIAALLNNPELERLYGLVVGYVQSGKTGHFTGLMARAADEGITFVIVLSGILNDLRNQTQIRLMKDLIGDHHNSLPHISTIQTDGRKKWELLTSLENDVKAVTREEMPERMKNSLNGNRILVAVVKKNVTVLEHLLNGIKAAGDDICGMHRVLIIDDEADHATVNTGGDGDQEMYDPNLEHDDDDLNDIDKDGDMDYLLGNWGKNSKFNASQEHPLRMYYADFDGNGSTETILCNYKNEAYYPLLGLDELASQIVLSPPSSQMSQQVKFIYWRLNQIKKLNRRSQYLYKMQSWILF